MALLSISNGYHTLLGSSKDESESKIVGLRILGHASYWDLFNNNPRHWSNPNWCKYPWMDRKHLLIHLFTEDEKRENVREKIFTEGRTAEFINTISAVKQMGKLPRQWHKEFEIKELKNSLLRWNVWNKSFNRRF